MRVNNKIIVMIFSFLIVLTLSFIFFQPKSQASLIDNARAESGSRPPSYGTDAPQNPIPPTSNENAVEITYDWFRGISGTVYEKTDNSSEIAVDVDNQVGIPGVRVIAHNNTTGYEASKYTNQYGNFEFKELPEGEYTVYYKYGDTNDTSRLVLALKYNGYDYIVSEIGGQDYSVNITKTEIEHSGKGAMQFMIILDISASAKNTYVTLGNGVVKRRLDVEIDATRKLIDKLFSSGENIYIGLVCFSGDAYRAASLTRDQGYLNKVLNYLQTNPNIPESPNSYISGALSKAEESFYLNGPNSNRAIVLISDGIPTKGLDDSGNLIETYSDDSDEVVMDTLKKVRKTTIKDIKKLLDDGIQFMPLIVESDEQDEVDWVKPIYTSDNRINFVTKKDGDSLVSSILIDIPKWVDKVSKYSESNSTPYVITGYEDAPRRKEVDGRFVEFNDDGSYKENTNKFYYAHTNPNDIKNISGQDIAGQINSLQIIDWLNSDSISDDDKYSIYNDNQQLISDIGNALYMTAQTGPYVINSPTLPEFPSTYSYNGKSYEKNSEDRQETYATGYYTEYWYEDELDPETNETVSVKHTDSSHTLKITYNIKSHEGVNMGLSKRQNFTLTIKLTATKMRITLSDNQVLTVQEKDMGSQDMLYENMDSDIAQGAVVEVEYTLTVQNTSSCTCDHLELMVNFPTELLYEDNAKLLSNPNVTNSSLGWTTENHDQLLSDGYISQNNYDTFKNRNAATILEDKSIDGFSLGPNQTFEKKVVVSRTLSSEDVVTIETEANAEILSYTNTGFRRQLDLVETSSGISKPVGVYPGNTYINDNHDLIKEVDFAECSNKVAIIPPTGYNKEQVIDLNNSIKKFLSRVHSR